MPANDIDLLTKAAERSGEIAIQFWGKGPKTWEKDDGAGPVTEADLATNAMLQETLLDARPDFGWLSEESDDNTERMTKKRVFVIDPIDGTRSFVAGERTWAHSLAIVEDGTPIAAVVYLPVLERMYTATADAAFLNGEPISASTRSNLEGAQILAARPTMEPSRWRSVPKISRHFRPSLAYRMCLVGQGRFDAMVTLRKTWEWDIAAGALIATAAGASVTDRKGNALKFNGASAQLDGVLSGASIVHDQMLGQLSPD